jgi:hypothetical protein
MVLTFRNVDTATIRCPVPPCGQITLSTLEFPTETKARIHLQGELSKMNGPQAYRAQNNSAVGLVIKRFTSDERIEEILKRERGETTIADASANDSLLNRDDPRFEIDVFPTQSQYF